MSVYDVIIAGAGPAGATAAYHLSQAGMRILVIEKKRLPRYKPCGGGISLEFLRREFPFPFDDVVETTARRVVYWFLDAELSIPVRPGAVAMVMRERFDLSILSRANCELREGQAIRAVEQGPDRVTVEVDGGEKIEACYLIGADGANSVVASALGMRRKRLIPAIEVEAQVPDSIYEHYSGGPVFIFEGPRYGYLWIFPKTNCLSVGAAGMNPRRGELQRVLEREMAAAGIRLNGEVRHGHSIPLYDPRAPVLKGRVLLAGDAAGTADPFSGEGIRPAIKSGRIAAQAIIAGRVEDYPRRLRKEIGAENIQSRLTAHFFYSLKELCLIFGAPNPATTEAILDMLADRGSALSVLGKSLATLPYFAASEVSAGVAGLLGGKQRAEQARARFFPKTYGER